MSHQIRPPTDDGRLAGGRLEIEPTPPGDGLLARLGGRPVGALRHWPDASSPTRLRWVGDLAVAPGYRRAGVASALLRRAASDAADTGHTALRGQPPPGASAAHSLLESLGWQRLPAPGGAGGRARAELHGLPLPRAVPDADDMRRLGRRLSAVLGPGDLVVLVGELGAGKTTLAQGVGAGLSVADRITSPTFVLAREHAGRLPLVHVDAYRLGSLAELDDLDLDTAMAEAVTLVEWGQGLAERLADGHLTVQLTRSTDGADDLRWVTLRGTGTAWWARQHTLDTGV